MIGQGGMGAVYRAVQTSLNREVAIKILPPDLNPKANSTARFRREALALAMLDHPNIVTIYDYGSIEIVAEMIAGKMSCLTNYLVMEYAGGMDLHKLMQAGRLTLEKALGLMLQIGSAVKYAHERGYLHRDIKPANIFLTEDETVKVGDLGLEKLLANESGAKPETGLTLSGLSVGTPHYIAPECQDHEAEIDQRSDIYSLGVPICDCPFWRT